GVVHVKLLENKLFFYTTSRGSVVRIGRRQSIPSSSIASCALVNTTVPEAACGHTKRPRSRRFANKHHPSPLHQSTFTPSPAPPRNTNRCPLKGSSVSWVCTSAASPSKPLRMSVVPAASHTRAFGGSAIIDAPEERSPVPAPSYRSDHAPR